MTTECTSEQFEFQGFGRRQIAARFDGGCISSDGGGLLLREVDLRINLMTRLANCFIDCRNQMYVEHSVLKLVSQRVYALALGYEDLNDHETLRRDPLLATLVGHADVQGQNRVYRRDQGCPLAGPATLNRMELSTIEGALGRYKKIPVDPGALDKLLVDLYQEAHDKPPKEIWLDLDATDDPLHGNQEGRFFNGYYDCYCYLPLYIFSGEHLLCARLRGSDKDAADGSIDELERIVGQIRKRWPNTRINVRGDSGFCREDLMYWCEQNKVGYLFGLASNSRLLRALAVYTYEAKMEYERTALPARSFAELRYKTRKSWSCERRVVGKAEVLAGGPNPRFVVTNIPTNRAGARRLYEDLYCIRGEMENRIKEQQLGLFADRTSTAKLEANQLRLYFSSFAYVLMHGLRRLGLQDTEFAKAQCTTIRLKLLKIGARVTVSVRRFYLSLSEAYPYQQVFARILNALQRQPIWRSSG